MRTPRSVAKDNACSELTTSPRSSRKSPESTGAWKRQVETSMPTRDVPNTSTRVRSQSVKETRRSLARWKAASHIRQLRRTKWSIDVSDIFANDKSHAAALTCDRRACSKLSPGAEQSRKSTRLSHPLSIVQPMNRHCSKRTSRKVQSPKSTRSNRQSRKTDPSKVAPFAHSYASSTASTRTFEAYPSPSEKTASSSSLLIRTSCAAGRANPAGPFCSIAERLIGHTGPTARRQRSNSCHHSRRIDTQSLLRP